jgi:hypothetical protein
VPINRYFGLILENVSPLHQKALVQEVISPSLPSITVRL